jgi:hypothetical protein
VKSGIDPESVTHVGPGHVETATLAALTGSSAADWDTYLAEPGGSLVLVSIGGRRAAVERLLREEGAEVVLVGDERLPHREAASAQATPPAEVASPVHVGMTVVSADRREVGTIKTVGRSAMLVARPVRPDVWVPLRAVDHVVQHWVLLTLPFLEVDVAASFLLKH